MAAQAGNSGIGTHPKRMVTVFNQCSYEIAAQTLSGSVTGQDAVSFRGIGCQTISCISHPQFFVFSP